ncbi:MAG: type III-A CRISPR-associated RAMP protein Csm4 [Anaerolineae bacterium]
MDMTVYRLTFRSGFHIGVRGVNLEESGTHIPSDTLFAALMDAALCTGSNGDEFVRPFLEANPPFLLTSAFPFAGNVLFFPMPASLMPWLSPAVLRRRSKELKRVRFLSEGLWRRMLDGERMDEWLFPEDKGQKPQKGVALQGGTFWLTADEVKDLPETMQRAPNGRPIPPHTLRHHRVFATAQVPRVTVDRVSSASNIFHVGRVSFADGCGLWFGVEWRNADVPVGAGGPSYRETFHRALAVLSDDGLGGERTAGYGGFSWKRAGEITLPPPGSGGLVWLLSRYHPTSRELPDALTEGIGYNLVSVGGWLRTWEGAAQRRQRLWLVGEGSLVRTVGSGPWGDLTDVRPRYVNPDGDLPHPVWRYGLALGAAVAEPPSDLPLGSSKEA